MPAFRWLYNDQCDLLGHLCESDQVAARRLIIDLVLATDIARHFSILAHFNAKVCTCFPHGATRTACQAWRRPRGYKAERLRVAARRSNLGRTRGRQRSVGNLELARPEDLLLWLQILLKCADVSNPGKWSGRRRAAAVDACRPTPLVDMRACDPIRARAEAVCVCVGGALCRGGAACLCV